MLFANLHTIQSPRSGTLCKLTAPAELAVVASSVRQPPVTCAVTFQPHNSSCRSRHSNGVCSGDVYVVAVVAVVSSY